MKMGFFRAQRTIRNKVITIITLVAFLSQSAAIAIPTTSAPTTPQLESATVLIPEQYGTLEKPPLDLIDLASQRVFLIKDAHCNFEAQTNIARILDLLIRTYQVDLVGVEGAAGKVTPQILLQADPGKEIVAEITEKYLHSGLLTGAEFLSANRGKDPGFTLWGVEDLRLYLQDYQSFRQTITANQYGLRFLAEATKIIRQLKQKLYPAKLREFDRLYTDYRENQLPLTEFIVTLNADSEIPAARYPTLALVIKSINLEEEIDFKQVERQRAGLIGELERLLPQQDLRELIAASLAYKTGKLSSLDYYTFLQQKISDSSDQLTGEYKHLAQYIKLVNLQSKIDAPALFGELDSYVETLYDKLMTDKTTSDLHKTDKAVFILAKLLTLQAPREDIAYYRANRQDFLPETLLQFLTIQAQANGINVPQELNDPEFLAKVTRALGPAEEFYHYALQRDTALIDNLLALMEENKRNQAALVCGGFHSEGIKRILNERGIAVYTISPAITKMQENAHELYLAQMMDQRVNPEKMLLDYDLSTLSPILPTGPQGIATGRINIILDAIEQQLQAMRGTDFRIQRDLSPRELSQVINENYQQALAEGNTVLAAYLEQAAATLNTELPAGDQIQLAAATTTAAAQTTAAATTARERAPPAATAAETTTAEATEGLRPAEISRRGHVFGEFRNDPTYTTVAVPLVEEFGVLPGLLIMLSQRMAGYTGMKPLRFLLLSLKNPLLHIFGRTGTPLIAGFLTFLLFSPASLYVFGAVWFLTNVFFIFAHLTGDTSTFRKRFLKIAAPLALILISSLAFNPIFALGVHIGINTAVIIGEKQDIPFLRELQPAAIDTEDAKEQLRQAAENLVTISKNYNDAEQKRIRTNTIRHEAETSHKTVETAQTAIANYNDWLELINDTAENIAKETADLERLERDRVIIPIIKEFKERGYSTVFDLRSLLKENNLHMDNEKIASLLNEINEIKEIDIGKREEATKTIDSIREQIGNTREIYASELIEFAQNAVAAAKATAAAASILEAYKQSSWTAEQPDDKKERKAAAEDLAALSKQLQKVAFSAETLAVIVASRIRTLDQITPIDLEKEEQARFNEAIKNIEKKDSTGTVTAGAEEIITGIEQTIKTQKDRTEKSIKENEYTKERAEALSKMSHALVDLKAALADAKNAKKITAHLFKTTQSALAAAEESNNAAIQMEEAAAAAENARRDHAAAAATALIQTAAAEVEKNIAKKHHDRLFGNDKDSKGNAIEGIRQYAVAALDKTPGDAGLELIKAEAGKRQKLKLDEFENAENREKMKKGESSARKTAAEKRTDETERARNAAQTLLERTRDLQDKAITGQAQTGLPSAGEVDALGKYAIAITASLAAEKEVVDKISKQTEIAEGEVGKAEDEERDVAKKKRKTDKGYAKNKKKLHNKRKTTIDRMKALAEAYRAESKTRELLAKTAEQLEESLGQISAICPPGPATPASPGP